MKTALGLILAATERVPAAPELKKPVLDMRWLVKKGINPSKSRKGRSGEIARTGGKGTR